MMVHLVKFFPIGFHSGRKLIVFENERKYADAVFLRHRYDALQNIHVAEFGCRHVRQSQRCVLVKLHVRTRIIAAVKTVRAGPFTHDAGAMRFVSVNEGKQHIHSRPRLQVVENGDEIALRERRDADRQGHHGG